jgi:spore coat polysaccharide biosynthesis protein SpsF
MLLDTIESLKCIAKNYPIIIATSDQQSDDETVNFCNEHNLEFYAGSLNNVVNRLLHVAENHDLDHIIRVCGDSPLIDHRIVEHAIDTYKNCSVDLVTNTFPRSYPKGQSIEIFSKNLLIDISRQNLPKFDFEHVTSHVYKNHEKYKICNISNHIDFSNHQLSVDTIDDFTRISNLLNSLDRPPYSYGWMDFLNLLIKE